MTDHAAIATIPFTTMLRDPPVCNTSANRPVCHQKAKLSMCYGSNNSGNNNNNNSNNNNSNNSLPPAFVASICPDIYTRLDVKIAERTRITNAGLLGRMQAQVRMLNKYKTHVMKRHAEEVEKLRQDLEKLHKCSPALESKTYQPSFHYPNPQMMACAISSPENIRQIGSPKLCHRCYMHHTPYKNVYYQNWWLKNFLVRKSKS